MAGIPEFRVEGHVARIELRRPEQANRLEPADLEALAGYLAEIEANPEILVVHFASKGKYFCSGYDIGQIGSDRTVEFEDVANAFENCRAVTIAVLQGGIYGGATDLVLACDFRIGAEGVDMFMPAARLGLHYYRGGLERYVTRLGIDVAKRLFLTAERIGAPEMKAIGYLTHLVPADDLVEEAERLTERVAGMAPIPLLGMKQHLNRIARGTLDVPDLLRDIGRAAESRDLQEGRAAWAEKRPARFIGH